MNKVLLATGLTSTIGQTLWARLKPCSWQIIGITHDVRKDLDPEVHWVEADLQERAERWLPKISETLNALEVSRIDGVFYGAGLVYSDITRNTTGYEWDATMAVNLSAAFHLGRHVFPYLGPGSSVVLLSSIDAYLQPQEGPSAAYGASKAGLHGLTRQWAAEWGPYGIRVNTLAPGALDTGSGPQTAKVYNQIRSRVALRRLGTADEVAAVAAFLLSEDASYLTGAWIPVDGGLGIEY